MKPSNYLAVFDVDGVLVRGTTQEHLARYLFRRKRIGLGLFFRIAGWFVTYKLGCGGDTLKIRQEAYKTFNGWTQEEMNKLMAEFFTSEVAPRLVSGMLEVVRGHRQAGHDLLIISASLEPLIAHIARYVGVERFVATRLESKNGKYTGQIKGDVPYGEHKKAVLEKYLSNRPAYQRVYVYADHSSDEAILSAVTDPIVVDPQPALRSLAVKKGWIIRDLQ